MTLAALRTACAFGLVALWGAGPAAAGSPRGNPAADGARSTATPGATIAVRADSAAADPARVRDFHLRRGIAEIHRGDPESALDHLERAAGMPGPGFSEQDRAAFLLGSTALRLGDRRRALDQTGRLLPGSPTPFALWVLHDALRVRAEGGTATGPAAAGAPSTSFPEADLFEAATALRDGQPAAALARLRASSRGDSPLGLYLQALALDATGDDAQGTWRRLAGISPASPLERDLAALAALRLAAEAARAGSDPTPLLASIPTGSRLGPRARLLAGTADLEQGRPDSAAAQLAAILSLSRPVPEHRDAALVLAGLALDGRRYQEAYGLYRSLETEGGALHEQITALRDSARWPELWSAWESAGYWPRELRLAAADSGAADRAFALALDRKGDSSPPPPPALDAVPAGAVPPLALLVPPPGADVWGPVERAGVAADQARASRLEAEHRAALRAETLRLRRAYLEHGLDGAARAERDIVPALDRLTALHARLDSLEAAMRDLKDLAVRRFTRRSESIRAAAELDRVAGAGMRRFHTRTPGADPPANWPRNLLAGEDSLSVGMESLAGRWNADLPGLIEASFATVWSPGLAGRIDSLLAEARSTRERAGALTAALTGAAGALDRDPELAALTAAVRVRRATEDSLVAVHRRLRDAATRAAIDRSLASLEGSREGIDYGLAVASYELSLAGDSTGAPGTDPQAAGYRREARERATRFLADFPESPARGEMRYRLADVLLTEAKDRFESAMAARIAADRSSGTPAAVPVLDTEPAVALYRSILAQDTTYPHRDAVLFNLGMIEIDDGKPDGETALAELVREFPSSPFVQEATLRLADASFDREDFATSIPLYESAAAGDDRGLVAIALYKLGWAHFREDRFEPSADAFRRLLDLYEAGGTVPVKTDLRAEAEDHFIHALARGGGARLFAETFDRIGPRPYERRTLDGLASLYRKFSLYDQAIAADRMFLERYPDDPSDLAVARRLTESYEAANRPDEARAARLEVAARFVPGSDWNRAAGSDSLRTEAEAFARKAYTEAAFHAHQVAKGTGGTDADWRKARDLYATVLRVWPKSEETGTIHLHAGDVAEHLDDYAAARDHFAAASAELPAGETGKITEADWELLAVTDRWYRSTVPASQSAGAPAAVGSDSLAAAVREAAGRFARRHPGDPRAADALWRRGTLAFAHGWLPDAAADYEAFLTAHPADPRAPRAAALRGDAWFKADRFDSAQVAYEAALTAARAAHQDTLAERVAAAIPLAAHRHAEAVAAKSPADAAPLFEALAVRWPDYEHAGVALYRAGLGYAEGGNVDKAVGAWNRLLEHYPKHEYARDARLQIAAVYEKHQRWGEAADAYRALSEAYPKHPDAAAAWLKSADLYAQAGDSSRAESARLDYVDRYPEDVAGGMGILEDAATRELDALGNRPVSALLGSKAPKGPLVRYLALAKAHPDLASAPLQARVQFLRGEEVKAAYDKQALTLPLDKSIARKKKSLDGVLAAYGDCAKFGGSEWARGATYRIGEALIGFGKALEESERPSDLTGDDRAAYDEVLQEQAWTFYDRGEKVWEDLLRDTKGQGNDPGGWLARTQSDLWPRLGLRLYGLPEVEHPVVAASAPAPGGPERAALSGGTKVPRQVEPPAKDGGNEK